MGGGLEHSKGNINATCSGCRGQTDVKNVRLGVTPCVSTRHLARDQMCQVFRSIFHPASYQRLEMGMRLQATHTDHGDQDMTLSLIPMFPGQRVPVTCSTSSLCLTQT